MGARTLDKVRSDLGVGDAVRAGFRARHSPPTTLYTGLVLVDVVVAVIASVLPSRRKWNGIDGLPRGTVAVGVAADELLLGRGGAVLVRRPLEQAFGAASDAVGDAWVEVCGVKLWVHGADADEARILQRRYNSANR